MSTFLDIGWKLENTCLKFITRTLAPEFQFGNDLFSLFCASYSWPLTILCFFTAINHMNRSKTQKNKEFVFFSHQIKKWDWVEEWTIKLNGRSFAFDVLWNMRIKSNLVTSKFGSEKKITQKRNINISRFIGFFPVCPVVDNDEIFQNRCDSGRCNITA